MDFINHLKKYLKDEEIERLNKSLSLKDQHALLLNTDKMDLESFKKLYPNITPHPITKNGFLYDKNEYQFGKNILHELGAYYLQEPSAMTVSSLLNVNEDDLILDMCAAPGGKSIQLSYKMHNKGLIIANDLSKERAEIIKENVERLGIGNIAIISKDFSDDYHKYLNTFDKIILDAPCSGSGMFRKSSEMKDDWTYEKVLKYSSIQKKLIHAAYNMLKPGGIISYSTCSFSYEEDEEVILDLLKDTDAEIIDFIDNPLFYKSKSNIGIHLFPYLFPGEGHYICQIKKPGMINKKIKKEIKNPYINKYDLDCSYPYFDRFKDTLFLKSDEFDLKNIPIIRYGLKVGDIIKEKEIKYDLHYARFISNFPSILEISEMDTIKYLKGETLNIVYPRGYVLLKYLGVNIDIAKSDGRIIKNRYPKYLKYRR